MIETIPPSEILDMFPSDLLHLSELPTNLERSNVASSEGSEQ